MAQWHAKGKLKVGDPFIHESIIGSQFIGTVEDEVTLGGWMPLYPA
jgi:4-hydroxyproline epimerase